MHSVPGIQRGLTWSCGQPSLSVVLQDLSDRCDVLIAQCRSHLHSSVKMDCKVELVSTVRVEEM